MREKFLGVDTRLVYGALLLALILFPYIVGWITGDSPYGLRGRPVGDSVFLQGMLIEVFIMAILAMSYNLLFGFTGVISFGHALFFGMGGYILGMMLERTDLETGPALVVGVVVGLVVSAVLSFLVGIVSLRLRGVYFAMFTLAVAEMFYIYFSRLPLTSAEDGFTIAELPDWLNPTRQRLTFYYITLAFFVLTFVFIRRLMNSPTGAVFLAIRENEERARAIGYHTLRFKLFAITTAGVIAALAGMLHILFNKKVGPEILSLTFTVDPLLMTIIGGIGTFTGPVIGAAGLHLSDRLFRDATFALGDTVINIGSSWALILGITFIVIVLVFPQGVVGTWSRWRQRISARDRAA
ncbi:MAG: branched-chain amino acid ABC transporter permease [Anaerolineae bacterium]|nr:branched-chain amino acid ABC transporter permease [Anaerolineae bacterium]